jgi:hypothetical protein
MTTTPVIFENETLYLIEGTFTALQTSRTRVNLLEKIQQNSKAKNLATGIAAAAGGMHGMVANSAALVLYDGEDMYNFAAMVGDQVICGSFEKADKFKDGDAIKAVVSKRGDVLYAHSLMRLSDYFTCMPLMTFAGKKAFFRGCMKVAWRFSIFGWIFFLVLFTILHANSPSSNETLIIISIMSFVFPPLIMYPMELWTYRSTKYYGHYASAIFTAYGFPRPDDLDLRDGMTHYKDALYGYGGMNAELALERHKKKYKLQ